MKNKCPDNEEIQRTMDIIKRFNIKYGEELTEIYLKSDVLLLDCVFEKFIEISINQFDINPLYCVSLPGYTWQCGLIYTGINIQTLQDQDLILLLENNIRGGISSVMGDRYIKSDENKNIMYFDANNLYGHSMSEPLPYDEIKFDNKFRLEDILNTPDVSDIGYFIELDLTYPNNIKEKTKNFPFAPMNKKINRDNFNDYMKEIKPDTYIQTSKLICDWSNKKNYLIHYRMLKFYVRHGMIVDKVHCIISTVWINFDCIDDYQKPVNNLKKEHFFSKLKNKCPDNEEIQRTMDIIKRFNIKYGEELTEIYLKSDVFLLDCVFEKFIEISINQFDINPVYCVSLPGYTWQCGLIYTGINIQTLQDQDLILLLENNIRGGISSVMGDRYIKSDENKNIMYFDANNLYGQSMSEPLPYDEIKFDNKFRLEDILNTPDVSDIGYFIELDLTYPNNIKEKTKNFPFAPMNKKINRDNFNDYMKEIKPDTYIQTSKLICDWSNKKNYLIHYRMLKFYVRHGMIVDKVHCIIPFKQSRWLE